jgi:putative tricarboxylic transport membrane protein
MLLGFVLGQAMEAYFRRALLVSDGSFWTFFTRPLSAVLLAVAAAVVITATLPSLTKKREEVFRDAE